MEVVVIIEKSKFSIKNESVHHFSRSRAIKQNLECCLVAAGFQRTDRNLCEQILTRESFETIEAKLMECFEPKWGWVPAVRFSHFELRGHTGSNNKT